jgi:hypothetical protein
MNFTFVLVFNEAIGDGKQIRTFNVDGMHGLGTPEDLNEFLKKDIAI